MDDRKRDQSKHVDLSEITAKKVGRHQHWFKLETGAQVCGSRLRKRPENERCARGIGLHPLRGRCRLHGGSNKARGRPVTTGTGVRFLHGRLGDIEERSRTDSSTTDLEGPVAALTALASRIGEMLHERDTPQYRKRALQRFAAVQAAVSSGNATGMVQGLKDLGELLEAGASEADSIEQFADVAMKLHTAIATTWRVALAKNNSFNLRHMQDLFAEFCRIVTHSVSNPAESRHVLDQIEAMLRRATNEVKGA